MAFGRQVGDHVWSEFLQGFGHRVCVTDVSLNERIAIARRHGFQRTKHARICQLVEYKNFVSRMLDQSSYQSGTDKTGAAGDQNTHSTISSLERGQRRKRLAVVVERTIELGQCR